MCFVFALVSYFLFAVGSTSYFVIQFRCIQVIDGRTRGRLHCKEKTVLRTVHLFNFLLMFNFFKRCIFLRTMIAISTIGVFLNVLKTFIFGLYLFVHWDAFCFTSHLIFLHCWIIHRSRFDLECQQLWHMYVITVIFSYCSVLRSHLNEPGYLMLMSCTFSTHIL